MNVLIYADEGVSSNSLSNTRAALSDLLADSYDLKLATAKTLSADPWESSTSLLVFPGGRDLPYCASLNGKPNRRIKEWVKSGGKYFGICAGAYYGSQKIEFEVGTGLEVTGDRELDFFHGVCKGAAFPGFVYNSESGARNAHLTLDSSLAIPATTLPSYWNGGGYFVTPHSSDFNNTVLARYAELANQPPAIVSMPCGQGKVVLSGPHPEHPLVGSSTYASELLRTMLKHLGLQIASSGISSVPDTTPQYLLSTDPAAVQATIECLLATYEAKVGQDLQDAGDTFYIGQSEEDQPATAEARQILPCNSTQLPRITFFTPHAYFQHLSTTSVGRSMLYGEVVTSTQSLLDRNPRLLSSLPTGLISVATRQVSGRGRGGNAWLSPEGCLMFSLILRAPPSLGAKLVFVQYLIALAAVRGLDPDRNLGLCIKWPNDIYADLGPSAGPKLRYQKIGGILVNNSFTKGSFTLVVGCGINLSNLRPTLSVNSLIERANVPGRGLYAAEEALAQVMNAFEPMWNDFVAEGSFEPFLDLYLSSWIHTGQIITLEATGQQVEILGVSLDHGFLITGMLDGSRHMIELQPDGNSFDMLQNLIRKK